MVGAWQENTNKKSGNWRHLFWQGRQSGFTLVELMVALFLGVIATVGMYMTYVNYSTAADVQNQTLELQQGLRVAMNRMVKEIRMAGYNPQNASGIGITVAKDNELTFTLDTTGNDGVINATGENITYSLSADKSSLWRMDNVTAAENGELQVGLDNAVGDKPINFVYMDQNRIVLTPGVGVSLSTADMQQIKFIRITLVFRSINEDTSYTDSFIYRNLEGTALVGPKNDHRRRQRLSMEVNIRNV